MCRAQSCYTDFDSKIKDYDLYLFLSSLQAYVVLGQFLLLKQNEELFVDWMKETCQANAKQSGDCYNCLKDWCGEFL